jgi:urease accessory protein
MPFAPLRTSFTWIAGLAPALALAHAGDGGALQEGFAAGFAHPFVGIDHLVAMLLIGVCSAPVVRLWWLPPLAFATMLLVGAALATGGLELPAVEPVVALSLVLLGALLARRSAWPVEAMAGIAALFAVYHGAAHGAEVDGLAALGGMVAATALLHAAGLAVGFGLRGRSRWWPRAAGLAAAGVGLVLLARMA